MRRMILALCSIALTLGFVSSAQAASITGVLNITGSVNVSATDLDWVPPEDGGYGEFTTKTPGSGYFSNIVSVSTLSPVGGFSKDLTLGPSGGGYTHVDIGLTSVDDFLYNFDPTNQATGGFDYTGLTFNLTEVVDPSTGVALCTGNIAAGTSCYLGPFLLTATASDKTTITLVVNGIFDDTQPAWDPTPYTGSYTTQLNFSVQQILDILDGNATDPFCTNNQVGTICSSYSANFVPTASIPEPASMITFGTGALLLALRRRRQNKRS